MKIASPGLISLLGSSKNLIFADLWTFTLKNGSILRYTSWDNDLTIDGVTWASHDVLLEGGEIKQARGLEVNETQLTCYPNLTDNPSVVGFMQTSVAVYGGLMSLASSVQEVVDQVPFLQACVTGMLDRAKTERFRIFMPTPGDTSLGAVRIFLGEINGIQVTRNYAIISCKDATDLLNIYMPRRQYQPRCPWTFGDTNCKFDKNSTMHSSAATAGSTQTNLLCSLSQATGFFNYGSVVFTSGQNAGTARAIKSYSPGSITLTGPLPQPVAVGDGFNVFQGCSKNLSGQTQSFNGAAATGIASTPNTVYSYLTNTAGFFNGGTLQFTSGANVGQTRTISSWQPATAAFAWAIATVSSPFPNTPAIGDEFVITSIDTNTTATCTGYNNVINFGGDPFVPIPETAY